MMRPDIDVSVIKESRHTLSNACALYRTTKSNGQLKNLVWGNVVPTDQDRQLALEIKSYYAAKIGLSLLRSQNSISNWRRDCYAYCIGEKLSPDFNYGLLLYLPYFYHEDQAKESLQTLFKSNFAWSNIVFDKTHSGEKLSLSLRHKMSIPILRKSKDSTEHWFQDQYNRPVMWKCWASEHNFLVINSLMKLWQDKTIEVKSFVDIRRDYVLDRPILALKLTEIVNVE